MRIGILTSSRADFGIYMPLLRQLKQNKIAFDIIAFGTHLSFFHGYTLTDIQDQGIEVKYKIETLVLGDSEEAIATSMGLTTLKFSSFWTQHYLDFDLVFCLGDRYEMFAAVTAGIPFNTMFAHVHAGETTLGAIDNVFRHAISHASKIHFTSTNEYSSRVKKMVDQPDHVFNVGALSLDNLQTLKLFTLDEFQEKWDIDLNIPTILTTFHPETISVEMNSEYALEIVKALKQLTHYQIIITMPNADTAGNLIRKILTEKLQGEKHIKMIESFGIRGYFTVMKYCKLLLGNTSSGIIEAASFDKYVIDLGDRQKGRAIGPNVFNTAIQAEAILEKINRIEQLPTYTSGNIYWNGGATDKILQVINSIKK